MSDCSLCTAQCVLAVCGAGCRVGQPRADVRGEARQGKKAAAATPSSYPLIMMFSKPVEPVRLQLLLLLRQSADYFLHVGNSLRQVTEDAAYVGVEH